MSKKQGTREFIDEDRNVMDEYHNITDVYRGQYDKKIEQRLRELIAEYPDFLESYLTLADMLLHYDRTKEGNALKNEAYNRAIALITDKEGNWPDVLAYGWIYNRHIIRAIYFKGDLLWADGHTEVALELFQKLLRTNPQDNLGIRWYILAIRMKMSWKQFEERFDRGGYYDDDVSDWFEKNCGNFPDDFDWWEKVIEEMK